MTVNSPAKILLVFTLLFSVLTGCGGEENATTPEAESEKVAETKSSTSESGDTSQPTEEEPVDDRETIITLLKIFLPSDEVPEAFIECWVDETLELNGFTAEELRNLLLSGDQEQALDTFQDDVVFTCISDLSPEDFAAVLASGILGEDEDDSVEDEQPDFSRDQTFPDTEAPDLLSNPAFVDEGIEIVISPGVTDGYLWKGTITGSGLPPNTTTAIFGCGGRFESVIADIFTACDFEEPIIAFTDNQGNFSSTIEDPQPTSPDGSCLIIHTDPDQNPETEDGPGGIVCTGSLEISEEQTLPDEVAPDLFSNPRFANPGIEVVLSPGFTDGFLWVGTVSGSGFTPGDIVGAVGCGATYESFLVTFVFSCDFENGYYLGDIAEDGTFTSQQIGPVPTVAEGTCVIVGTDPDNNPDTDDGEAAVLCSR